MQPEVGGYYPRANAPSGRYRNANGGGFRSGRGQPYRPPAPPEQPYRRPAPPEQQMTPQQRFQVLMAAGRLAAEYLVDRGDLPPDVLENRPPAPIPFQQGPPSPRTFRFEGRPPAPPPQQHRQQWHRPSHFQGQHQRPPAHQRWFPGPRQFQGGHGPFPKRPRQGPPRSFPDGPRAPGPPPKKTGFASHAAAPAPPVAESKMQEDKQQQMAGDKGNIAVAGEASDSQPTAQSGGASPTSALHEMNEPS